MRTLMIIGILSALTLVFPGSAQSQETNVPSDASPVPELSPRQDISEMNFTTVAIVAVEDLPPQIRPKVEAVITQTSKQELSTLQGSISASPQVTSLLAANGLDASQVVAANLDDNGILTLIIQTTT